MLAEWKFSQKFKISRKTIGRVAAGLCIRNFNIKEWEHTVFLFVQLASGGSGGSADVFKY